MCFTGAKNAFFIITEDYWDRTWVHRRCNLHAHILVWFRMEMRQRNWEPLAPTPAPRQGATTKQRNITETPIQKLRQDETHDAVSYTHLTLPTIA